MRKQHKVQRVKGVLIWSSSDSNRDLWTASSADRFACSSKIAASSLVAWDSAQTATSLICFIFISILVNLTFFSPKMSSLLSFKADFGLSSVTIAICGNLHQHDCWPKSVLLLSCLLDHKSIT